MVLLLCVLCLVRHVTLSVVEDVTASVLFFLSQMLLQPRLKPQKCIQVAFHWRINPKLVSKLQGKVREWCLFSWILQQKNTFVSSVSWMGCGYLADVEAVSFNLLMGENYHSAVQLDVQFCVMCASSQLWVSLGLCKFWAQLISLKVVVFFLHHLKLTL